MPHTFSLHLSLSFRIASLCSYFLVSHQNLCAPLSYFMYLVSVTIGLDLHALLLIRWGRMLEYESQLSH